MNKYILTIALYFILSSPVLAEGLITEVYTDTGVPTREDAESRLDGLHGTVGAALLGVQKIRGYHGNFIGVTPIPMMRYEDIVYISFASGGVWLLQNSDHSLRCGVGLQPHGGWHGGDDPTLHGMEDRDASVDGYLNAAWRTKLVAVGTSYYHDILNGNRGDAASIRFSKDFRPNARFRLTPGIGFEWQSSERVDYYYGVRPSEATPFRPAYVGIPAVNLSAAICVVYRLATSWSFLSGISTARLGSGIASSPIVSRRYATSAYVGAGLSF